MSLSLLVKEMGTPYKMLNEPLPSLLIENILETAVWAPNHKHREPWRFIYMENEYMMKLVEIVTGSRHSKTAQSISHAPAALIVVAAKNADQQIASDDFAAACCLIQNIRLLGTEKGLVIEWNLEDYSDCSSLNKLTGVRQDEKIAGILAIARRRNKLESEQKEATERYIKPIVQIQSFSELC